MTIDALESLWQTRLDVSMVSNKDINKDGAKLLLPLITAISDIGMHLKCIFFYKNVNKLFIRLYTHPCVTISINPYIHMFTVLFESIDACLLTRLGKYALHLKHRGSLSEVTVT